MTTRTAICHQSVRSVVVLLLIGGFFMVGVGESWAQADPVQAEVERLIGQLKDEDELVRRDAAEALGMIGPEAAPAVEALIEALKDEVAQVRRDAAWALGKIGPAAAPAVEALIEALKDESVFVRRAAAAVLGRIDPATNPSP